MDSAHAELLASEAWRNICDTFFVDGVTAGCSCTGEAGPLPPTVSATPALRVTRQITVAHFSVALQL